MEVFKDSSLLDVNIVCRACMCEKGNFKNIFIEDEFDSSLSTMFERMCNVQISVDDGLPSHICTKCILKIRSAICFSEQCAKSRIILRSSFSKRTTCLSDYLINFNDKDMGHNKFTNIDQIEDSNDISEKIMDMSMIKEEVSDDDLMIPNLQSSTSIPIFSHFDRSRENIKVCHSEDASPQETVDVETISEEENNICEISKSDIITNESEQLFSCNICSFSDCSKTNLMRHKNTHFIYPCRECLQRFKTLQDVLSHLCIKGCKQSTHAKKISRLSNNELIKRGLCILHCHLCNKEFKYIRSLRFHIRTHTGEKPALCNWCGKSFREQRALLNHIRAIHTDERKFKCSFCPKVFTVSGKKKQHERTHTGEKPYKCDICGHLFSAKPTLNTHRRIHTKELKFSCAVDGCGEGFYAFSTYQRHLRAHRGERPYQCQICEKTYLTTQHLRSHIKAVHTNFRNEICHVCGRSYSEKSGLNRHLRKIHHVEPKTQSTPSVNIPK